MNPIERQMQLGRELMEMNTEWFRKIAEFDSNNMSKYVTMNQEFGKKLPEVKDIQSFVELQREYAESMWNNTREVLADRGELVREAFEANTSAVRDAFQPAEAEKKAKKAA